MTCDDWALQLTFVLVDHVLAIDVHGSVGVDRYAYFSDVCVYLACVEPEKRTNYGQLTLQDRDYTASYQTMSIGKCRLALGYSVQCLGNECRYSNNSRPISVNAWSPPGIS